MSTDDRNISRIMNWDERIPVPRDAQGRVVTGNRAAVGGRDLGPIKSISITVGNSIKPR